MILGVGLDMERAERFAAEGPGGGEGLLERVFTAGELEYCRRMARPAPFFAARFAAKEALFKALGTGKRGGMSWLDVEVVHDELDKPALVLAGETGEIAHRLGVSKVHVSLTHTGSLSAALVVLEG